VHLLPRISSFSIGPVCKKIEIKRWRDFWGCVWAVEDGWRRDFLGLWAVGLAGLFREGAASGCENFWMLRRLY